MNPGQDQYPVDYLNQIAPAPPKQPMTNKTFFLLIGGGLLLAIIIGMLLLGSGGNNNPQRIMTLSARLQTLQSVAQDSQKNIKSGDLRSINSNLSIVLTDMNRDLATEMDTMGMDAGKIDGAIKTAEGGEELRAKLDDARLNAVFDRTYTVEMSYQLERTAALMQVIKNESDDQSLVAFIDGATADLQKLYKQLSEFKSV